VDEEVGRGHRIVHRVLPEGETIHGGQGFGMFCTIGS
jgi:hypothetical protein